MWDVGSGVPEKMFLGRGGSMAESRYKDLSSNLQYPLEKWAWSCVPVPLLFEGGTETSGLLGTNLCLSSSGLSERSNLKGIK